MRNLGLITAMTLLFAHSSNRQIASFGRYLNPLTSKAERFAETLGAFLVRKVARSAPCLRYAGR